RESTFAVDKPCARTRPSCMFGGAGRDGAILADSGLDGAFQDGHGAGPRLRHAARGPMGSGPIPPYLSVPFYPILSRTNCSVVGIAGTPRPAYCSRRFPEILDLNTEVWD